MIIRLQVILSPGFSAVLTLSFVEDKRSYNSSLVLFHSFVRLRGWMDFLLKLGLKGSMPRSLQIVVIVNLQDRNTDKSSI